MNKKEIAKIKQEIRNKVVDEYRKKGISFSKTFQEHKKNWDWYREDDECSCCGAIGKTTFDEYPICYKCYLQDWKNTWHWHIDVFDNASDASEVVENFKNDLKQEWWKAIKTPMLDAMEAFYKAKRDWNALVHEFNQSMQYFKEAHDLYCWITKKELNPTEKDAIMDYTGLRLIDMEIHQEHWVVIEKSKDFYDAQMIETKSEIANCKKIYFKAQEEMIKMGANDPSNKIAQIWMKMEQVDEKND